MKKLFRKTVSVLGSVAMIGATISTAAAATFPAPFDAGDYAVVYGASSQDSSAANVVASGLPTLGGSSSVVLGSDSYLMEKSSTKFHVGDTMTAVVSATVDEDEMPILLAEGKFIDDDNDEFDYTQTITLQALQLTMFEDSDYKSDEPELGFQLGSGTTVLTYTVEFTDEPLLTDLATSEIPIMGSNFYVLSTGGGGTALEFTLLDSAVDTVLTEGESTTINVGGVDHQVSIEFIDSSEVKLNVNGEATNSIGETETYKLSTGAYIGVKDILYNAKDTGVSKVEFSIGGGKLKLTSGSEVELNDENINGLTATITNSSATDLTSVALTWETDDDEFITPDSEVVMPGFGIVKLSMVGVEYPAEEAIEVAGGSDDYIQLNDFPLQDSVEDIDLLYATSGAYAGLGKDANDQLLTDSDGNMTFDGDLHQYFVASWSDGDDAESYLMRATNFKTEDSTNKTTFQYRKDNAWVDAKTDRDKDDTFSLGNAELAVGAIDKAAKTVQVWNNSASTNFKHLYSKEGMRFYLPVEAANTSVAPGSINFSSDSAGGQVGHNASSWYLTAVEEDKDNDKALGNTINVTLGLNTQSTPEPSVTAYSVSGSSGTEVEILNTDVFRNFVYSALATEILHDKGPDQRSLKLMYHGTEVEAKVYISSNDITSSGSTSGQKTFMDSESGYSDKNVVAVGGSCINSVTASLLGGSHCGDAFTGATAVGPGEFLIQTFDYNGKVATVVAGYDKEDTDKAAAYLNNDGNAVMTDVGVKYKGQTATESAVKVA